MTTLLVALVVAAALVSGHWSVGAEEERPATNSPKFISTGGSRQVREGDDLELLCDVDDLGEFVLLWKFNRSLVLFAGNLRIHRDDRISRDDLKGSLIIRGFRPENAGEYSCQVSTNPPQDITYHVHVLGPPLIHAQPQSDIVVKKGERIALTCHAEGASVEWRRANQVVATGPELRLEAAREEDAGQFECVASNDLGQSRRQFEVRVLYAPRMEARETLVHAPLDSHVRLECRFSSEPTATVSWFRGPESKVQRLLPSEEVRIETHAHESALLMPRVTRQLYDEYTCVANNSLGAATHVFQVTGRPSRPAFDTPPLVGRQESALLQWRVRSEPPITKYSVRVRQVDVGGEALEEWRVFEFRPPEGSQSAGERTDSYRVPELGVDQRYEAEVWAENEFGETRSHAFAFVTSASSLASSVSSVLLIGLLFALIKI